MADEKDELHLPCGDHARYEQYGRHGGGKSLLSRAFGGYGIHSGTGADRTDSAVCDLCGLLGFDDEGKGESEILPATQWQQKIK